MTTNSPATAAICFMSPWLERVFWLVHICYKYKDPKAHLDSRQQTSYTCNKCMHKWNRNCIICFVENIQNCTGCADYCVEYTRKFATTDLLITITQGGMCVLDNLKCETGKTGSRASTLICLIESFTISFSSGPTSCYGIDFSHGSKWSKKGIGFFVERCRPMTHARKTVIAVDALNESSLRRMRIGLWLWQKGQGLQRTKNITFSLRGLPWVTGCAHLARVVVII